MGRHGLDGLGADAEELDGVAWQARPVFPNEKLPKKYLIRY
jgi:hypothetical protein